MDMDNGMLYLLFSGIIAAIVCIVCGLCGVSDEDTVLYTFLGFVIPTLLELLYIIIKTIKED